MRTLKKALSLVLVLAMVFALAVPGFAANTTKKASDFKDYSKVTNKEAVDVLTAVGVINGNADGTFNPEGSFTRAEAATMITYLTLGKTVANALPVSATKFSDVPATHWAAKYVQYCADAGIVAGVGNGKFDPDAKLTATQWALMLLGALGYKAANEGISGEGWELATTRLAMKAGVASAEELTGTFNRDMAAKLAFKTAKATTVEYTGGSTVTVNGVTFTNGATRKNVPQGSYANIVAIDGAAVSTQTLQLIEKAFPKVTAATGADGMGRTSTTWKNGTTTVGTYSNAASYTAYATAANNTVAKVVDSINKKFNDAAANVYVNGAAKTLSESLKVGDKVEVFMNTADSAKVDTIAVTSYTVATLTADAATKVSGDDTLVRVPGVTGLNTFTTAKTSKTVLGYNGLVKGDVVLFYVDANGVTTIEKAASFDGTVTAVSGTTVTVSGKTYAISGAKDAMNSTQLAGFNAATATFYTDAAGNVVKAVGTESTILAYVVEDGSSTGIFAGSTTYYAKLLTTDGEVLTVKTSASASSVKNKFVKYSVKDEVYTLTADTATTNATKTAAASTTATVAKGNPTVTFGTTKIATDATTVFFVRNYDSTNRKSADAYTKYVGFNAVPSMTFSIASDKTAVAYLGADGYADYVVIDPVANVTGVTSATDVFYVVNNAVTTLYDAKGIAGYSVKAIKNGSTEITDLQFAASPTVEANKAYVATSYNDKGQVASFGSALTTTDPGEYIVATGYGTPGASSIELNGTAYAFTADTTVYYVDTDNKLTVMTVADLQADADDTFVAIRSSATKSDSNYNTIKTLFVKQVKTNVATPELTKDLDATKSVAKNTNLDFTVAVTAPANTVVTYTWTVDGKVVPNATATTYTTQWAEAGPHTVKCTVTYTNLTVDGTQVASTASTVCNVTVTES